MTMPMTLYHRGRFRVALRVATLALLLAGCKESFLTVSDGDNIDPGSLNDEAGLQARRNGALGDFVWAYAGGDDNDGTGAQLLMSGLMTDEWMHSGTFTTRAEVELRAVPNDNGTLASVYLFLHQARAALENTAELLEEHSADPTGDERISEMLAFAGFTYIAFGENYCSGVPFSKLTTEGQLELGSPETTEQVFNRAIARFDAALAHGAITPDIADMARVGKGRALLNLAQYNAAAAAVAGVADDFAQLVEHSENTEAERNSIVQFNQIERRWSVGDNEGINGLDFRSANDPRIQWSLSVGDAFDQSFPDFYRFNNYTTRSDPIAFVTGIEARLIEAEAMLQAGNDAGWLAALNSLRANFATLVGIVRGDASGTLSPLAMPGSAAGREDLQFRERAFWLYATGHRLGDLRRLIRQYGRGAETVFPTGASFKGPVYGTDVNLPIPQEEENNGNFTGCLDRGA